MKRFNLDSQIACIITFILALNVYLITSVYIFQFRRITLNDIQNHCKSHELAAIRATNDFNNNKLFIIEYGMLEIEEAHKMEKMEEKYGVIFLSGGCVCCGEYVSTYEQVMKHLINDKYKTMIFRTNDSYSLAYFKQNKSH
jgi:hypothetical protein